MNRLRQSVPLLSAAMATATYSVFTNSDDQNAKSSLSNYMRLNNLGVLNNLLLKPMPVSQAFIDDQKLKSLKDVNTDVYVYGDGYQVDASQEYSNFTPKKIRAFAGKQNPNIVDMAFGWYHEAYIDKEGKLYIARKERMSSIKVSDAPMPDGQRELTEVKTLPKGSKVRQVSFVRQRMFVMTTDGKLYSFKIVEKPPTEMFDPFTGKRARWTGELQLDKYIWVKDLPPLKMIASGQDHFLALDKKGQVWAMGDDTFGQCGQGGDNRAAMAPFEETRCSKPVQIPFKEKITKVVCGFRHSLAITECGQLYGWGFNSMQQLSNQDAYIDPDSPAQAIFDPVLLKGPLDQKFVVDAAAGEEHTVVVCHVVRNGKVLSELVYACGNNLKGQLGINRISHLNDFTLIEDISELYDGLDENQSPLTIQRLSCGRRHCMASFGYGAFVFWGDNEVGQLGNRKRSFIESPYPLKKFEQFHNVENVILGDNMSAVIVENLPPRKKNKNRKKKRTMTMQQVQDSEASLKAEAEKRMAELSQKEAKEVDDQKAVRQPMMERVRGKVLGTLFKDEPKATEVQKIESKEEKKSEIESSDQNKSD